MKRPKLAKKKTQFARNMLNRFSTAVQGAVQGAVTNVSSSVMGMMGEDISKLYEMPKDSTASGGHELLWKIYPGICKKSGLEVSIFVFDKDEMKKQHKDVQERIIDIMRTDMKTLRVLRHPHVLKVEHVFEETKRSLAFVTEKIICSLANARKRFDHVGNVTPEVLEVGLVEFELACGFMHIGEALSFLHREGRRVHMTIGPQSVFITPTGNWKLAGLGFSRVVENQVKCRSEYYSGSVPESKKNVPLLYVDPPLEYCAPELVTEPREFNTHADMFSLGLLVYEMFKAPLSDGTRGCILESRDRNQMTHGYKVQSLHPISFPSSVPVGLHNTIRSLLAIVPEQRPEARAFLASPFFNAGPVKDLRSLQTLVELEPSEQAKYLDTLKDKIKDFSPRILRDMVLPGLQTVVMNKQLAPFVIPPLLEIVAVLDKSTFSRLIAPMMIPLLGIVEPVQCMLMFASGLHVILPKAEDAYIRDHVVPMLCRCLDSTVPEILDTVLQKIVDHADLFEYQTLKAVILPRVIKLIMQPPKLSVRVNALLWLGKSYHVFDKDLLANTVLPTLGKTLEVDKSPTVCMCVLACYDNLGKHLGSEFIATAILPAVTPLLWEKSLDGKNFDIVCQKVQAMLQQVMKDRDEMFMSQNAVKGATTALERKSGIRSAVKAKEDDEDDATVRVNAMLQDKVAEPSSTKKGAYQDEPFYTSDSNKDPEPSSSTYASKRREKKKNRNKSKPAPTATADILNLETTTNVRNVMYLCLYMLL